MDERKLYIKKEGRKKKKRTKVRSIEFIRHLRSIWFIRLENREEKQDDDFDASN